MAKHKKHKRRDTRRKRNKKKAKLMTSYVTPELLKSLSRLKEKYPDAFETKKGISNDITHLVPADDPDLRTIVRFRNAVKAGDRRRLEDKRVAQRIADCYTRYMTMRATAGYLEMDLAEVKFITEHDANLRDLYYKHQHDWGRIIVYDDRTNSYTTYPSKYEAAVKIGFQRLSDLNYYLKYRHYPYLIKGRFKVKRRVWFDEDGCM